MLDIKRVTFPQDEEHFSLALPGFRSNLSIEQVVWEWQALTQKHSDLMGQ